MEGKTCRVCQVAPQLSYTSYCRQCWRDYMRIYMRGHRQPIPTSDPARVKYLARKTAGKAFERGRLQRQPCVTCGAPGVDKHHPDYAHPLEIVWLCKSCHVALHNELRAERRPRVASTA